MPVVDVRIVRVPVDDRLVDVRVRVGLVRSDPGVVGVLMVLVMDVAVQVFEPVMVMLVLVPLRDVQPGADGHQNRGGQEAETDGLAQEH